MRRPPASQRSAIHNLNGRSNAGLKLPLLIVAAGVLTYWNSLSGPFTFDDINAIVTNPTIQRSLWDALSPPRNTPVAGRPLVNLSFAINYALGGLNVTGYHVVNVTLHIACALLLFGIVRRTLLKSGLRPLFPEADITALVTALLWMLHPLQSEVVNYITQRSESLMGVFFLLTLYCAIRAQEVTAISGIQKAVPARPSSNAARRRAPKDNNVPHPRGTDTKPAMVVNPWNALAILACACGMLTKESMAVAPLIVVLYDWAFGFDSFRAAIRARGSFYAGLASTWTILAVVLWSAPRSTVGASATVGVWTYLVNQVDIIGCYLRLSIWPSDLVLDYGLPRPLALRDVLPGALAIVALVVAAGVALVRSRAIGFLAVWFFLTLAPTSSVIPITSEVGAERRMYLPFAALATLAVVAGRAWFDRVSAARVRPTNAPSMNSDRSTERHWTQFARIATAGLTLAVLLALAGRTIARNAEYQNLLTLWRVDVDRRPNGRARMTLAGELDGAGQHDEALAQFREAIKDFPDARLPLGGELILEQQQFEEGIAVLRQFIADGPPWPKLRAAHALIAQAFASEDKLDLAAAEWRTILKVAPGDAEAKASLAQILSTQGSGSAARKR